MAPQNPASQPVHPSRTPLTLPPQPPWKSWEVDWHDYDVPRIWDSLSCVSHLETWEQAQVFARQADQLNAQADELERLWERLAEAWSGGATSAAAAALARISHLINTLRLDAYAAATTARGVNGVLEALSEARQQMRPLTDQWLTATGGSRPQRFWGYRAEKLNAQAWQIMSATDDAVRDHRTNIVLSRSMERFRTAEQDPDEEETPGPRTTISPDPRPSVARAAGPRPLRPPVFGPGEGEIPDESVDAGEGPVLGGMPIPPISAGGGSMMPIFPGNPHAPGGGAYVMPGSGGSGQVVPMPTAQLSVPSTNARGGPAGMMPMPMPFGGVSAGRGGDVGSLDRRGADTRWEVAQGGPAVIVPDAPVSPPVLAQQNPDEFREWYTEVATPWRLKDPSGEPTPTVVIRRGVQ